MIARVQSRREFFCSAGAFALSASLPLEYTQPELILYNWNIIIVNDRQPRAEAVAIAGNRFLAVGMNEKVLSLASGKTKKINLESRIQTLHGAYASFEEHRKGSVQQGKLADLVVLGRDPLHEEPLALVKIPIERTMVGGRWVFES